MRRPTPMLIDARHCRLRPQATRRQPSHEALVLQQQGLMRKRQGRFAFNPAPTLKEQFEAITA